MAKGYKLVITHFLGLPAKYNYSALPRPHIVFCLQPLEVGYNYYIVASLERFHHIYKEIDSNVCLLVGIIIYSVELTIVVPKLP